jgi:signal peptide peptidase SppA
MKIEQLQAAAAIVDRPWLIMQTALPRLAGAIANAPKYYDSLEMFELEDFFEMRPEASFDESTGIGTVHVHQALMDSGPKIYEKLGFATFYSTIQKEIADLQSRGMKGLLLVHDSPGGTVAGNVELADLVAGLEVPVVSFASGLCCSASYKIASGSNAIVASPSATVGNIGTILSWLNVEEFWASMGVRTEAIVSEGADLKSTFHKEPNEAQRAFLQEGVNESGEQFRLHVEAGREAAGADLDEEVFRAGWYSGAKAGALGLIDEIGGVDYAKEILAGMIDNQQPSK